MLAASLESVDGCRLYLEPPPLFHSPRLPSPGGERKHVHMHAKSMSSFPDYVAKFRSKMVEIRSNFRRTSRNGVYHDYWLPPSLQTPTSSSTPTVPLSSTDLLYGSGGESRHQVGSRDGAGGSEEGGGVEGMGAWDHRSSQDKKLKELDLHGNKRPPSRNTSNNRKVPGFDKVSFDRDREELRPLGTSLSPTKACAARTNGIKNNLLRAEQFLPQRNNGRDEDLVAMGTIWSPSQLQTRGSSTNTNTSSSGKSTSAPVSSGGSGGPFGSSSGGGGGAGNGGGGSGGGGGGVLLGRRPVNVSTSTSTRQLLSQQYGGFNASGTASNGVRAPKEVEPKYSDPLSGASPTFQQRLMELAALEAETVRWERTKKIKKKPKQDRDS